MKTNFKNISILALVAMMLVMASCGGEKKRKDGRTDTTTQGEISFACDESFSPIIDELIGVYEMQCPNTKLKPIYTNEIDGVNMLLKQKTWLTITARNFTPKEYTYVKDGLNMLPEAVRLAYDGMALICNTQNLDSCISVKDVKNILLGKKTKWNEVNLVRSSVRFGFASTTASRAPSTTAATQSSAASQSTVRTSSQPRTART